VKKSALERIFWYFLSLRNIVPGKLLSGGKTSETLDFIGFLQLHSGFRWV